MRSGPEPLKIKGVNWLKPAIAALVLGIIGAALFGGLDLTGKPSFCGSCHAMQVYVKTWNTGSHQDALCVDCHQEPGVIGGLTQRAEIAKHYGLISMYFQRQRPSLASGVSTAGCLRCHEAIGLKTIKTAGGVKVSHKEMIAAGLNCGRCHAKIAHFSKAAKAQRPAHDYCFACHQKMSAGRKCAFCHTRDIGDTGPKQIDNYRKVELNLNACDGCHSTDSCADCHPSGRRLEQF